MFLAGSRYVSEWFDFYRGIDLAEAYQEGSPVDAFVFSLLIITGSYILTRRNIDWGQLLRKNKLIWMYFFYCGISIAWADYPFVSFKRLLKEYGDVIMVLVILTESHPYASVALMLRRLSYVLLPLSVLFIKYYPELGRAYHQGMPMFTGVAQQKNGLGQLCLIAGIYFSWEYILNRKEDSRTEMMHNIPDYILIGMLLWLLYMSNSSTSIACLVVAVSMFCISRMNAIAEKRGRIITLMIILASLFFVLDLVLDIKGFIIAILGRRPDLTDRVSMWQMLNGMVVNPLLGAGYLGFWSIDRLRIIWDKLGTTLINAHNGYLEQYLNLGYIGVAFIGGIIINGLIKIYRYAYLDYPSAMLRLCFVVVAIFYNYTEASFFGINNIWLLLLVGVFDISYQQNIEKIYYSIEITEN